MIRLVLRAISKDLLETISFVWIKDLQHLRSQHDAFVCTIESRDRLTGGNCSVSISERCQEIVLGEVV